jgi:hypothetical protein
VPFKSEKIFEKEWSHFRFKKEEDVLHFVQLLLLRWKFFFLFYLAMKWIPFSNVRNRGAYRRGNRQKSIWLNREPRIMSTYDLAFACIDNRWLYYVLTDVRYSFPICRNKYHFGLLLW